ncbi:hypothetical protein SESBI_38442 [Sesbania bispinosa]|nr:hypothetical protein SESBI_38442 [Sesbania bispinosa]
MEDRKCEIRPETRFNCQANFRVHVDKVIECWYATMFNDEHTHHLLDPRYSRLLPGNRKMTNADIIQMNSMLKAGVCLVSMRLGSFGKSGLTVRLGGASMGEQNELEDEFDSINGEAILQTNFPSLGKSGSNHYTRRILKLFRGVLNKTEGMTVTGSNEILLYTMFSVCKLQGGTKEWQWAKGGVGYFGYDPMTYWDSHNLCRIAALLDYTMKIINVQTHTYEDFANYMEKVNREWDDLKEKKAVEMGNGSASMSANDPVRASTKGKSPIGTSSSGLKVKCKRHC